MQLFKPRGGSVPLHLQNHSLSYRVEPYNAILHNTITFSKPMQLIKPRGVSLPLHLQHHSLSYRVLR